MQNLASSAKQHISTFVLVMFVAAIALPSILAAQAFAAQIASRSLQLSSSAAGASSVTYQTTFNTATLSDLGSIVIDFDGATPLPGDPSVASGVGVSDAGVTVSGVTGTWTAAVSANEDDALVLTANAVQADVAADTTITITATGFTNPATDGTYFARIVTYATTTEGAAYEADEIGDPIDEGGIAFAITKNIQVTALVEETLSFTVSKSQGDTDDPEVTLGQGTPPALSLSSSTASEDSIWYNLTTNSVGYTTIRIKGDSTALTSGSASIPGAATSVPEAFTASTNGSFGFRTANGVGGSAILQAATRYASVTPLSGNTDAAVTSTYGDILTQGEGATDSEDGELYFVAISGSNSPAGIYTASYSLIATPSY